MFWIGFALGSIACVTFVFFCAVSYQIGRKR